MFKHQPAHHIHRVREATVEEQYWFFKENLMAAID
jgi:hypothetical protein